MKKYSTRMAILAAPVIAMIASLAAPIAVAPASAVPSPTVTVPAATKKLKGAAPVLYKKLTGNKVITTSGFDPSKTYRAILTNDGAYVTVSSTFNYLMPDPNLNDGAHNFLQMLGTPSQLNDALATVTLTSTGQPGTLKVSVGAADSFYDPESGFTYQVINCGGCTWEEAYTNVQTRTYQGMQGYLFSPRSRHQDQFVADLVSSDSWMGASDDYRYINAACGNSAFTGQGTGSQAATNPALAEGKWYWVMGPMKCTRFFTETKGVSGYPQGGGGGDPVNGEYNGWAAGEPNNWGGSENFSEKYAGDSGWNDFGAGQRLSAYIVQYGGMPGDNPVAGESANGQTGVDVKAGPPGTPIPWNTWSGDGYVGMQFKVGSDGGSPITSYTVLPYQVKGRKVAYTNDCQQISNSGGYVSYECSAVNFKQYSFLVSATNAIGTGRFVDFGRQNYTTTPDFYTNVTGVYATGLKDVTVAFYGNASSPVEKYKVIAQRDYNRTSGSCTVTGANAGGGNDYDHAYSCSMTLRPGSYYGFQVIAKPVGGSWQPMTCWDCEYTFSTSKRPGDVTGIRARSNHDGSVEVSYSQAKGAGGSWHYAFAYAEDGTYVGQCAMGYTYDSSSCSISGLTQGVRYKFLVRSYNEATDLGFLDPKSSLSVRRIA